MGPFSWAIFTILMMFFRSWIRIRIDIWNLKLHCEVLYRTQYLEYIDQISLSIIFPFLLFLYFSQYIHFIRSPLTSERKRSFYITRATRTRCTAHELSILTDLKVSRVNDIQEVDDWATEVDNKEVGWIKFDKSLIWVHPIALTKWG